MPRPDDYAVLVGIKEYPAVPVSPLEGPISDVEYFEKWLVDPAGGDVDPTHIKKLTTQKPAPNVPPYRFPPTREDFVDAMREIVMDAQGQLVRRPEGRLYLYFSGHGFSDFRDKARNAALYTANVLPAEPSNVGGTRFAEWCRRSAAFGEVILVMDCCRDEELSKEVLEVTFKDDRDPELEKKVRLLEIYAVPYGGKAQERYFSDRDSHHGVLTYALIAALYGAPLEKVKGNGNKKDLVRNGHALKEFIEGIWDDLAGDDGPEMPEIYLPPKGDIVFSKEPPRPVKRAVHFAPAIAAPATLRVLNDSGDAVRVDLDAAAATLHYPASAAPEVRPFDGNSIELELQPEFYELVLEQPGAPPRESILPAVGDKHVTI